ncbi:MAG TPA: hypothetical protein VIA06_01460 [Candidatus Dormibacteraeota bacterium]|jgi:hypothetical protein|nr:hypothetical protein [Candidatus Dormibacteraeota bacterium]
MDEKKAAPPPAAGPDPAHSPAETLNMLRAHIDHLERTLAGDVQSVEHAGERLLPAWRRATAGEHRLPVAGLIVIAIVLQLALPEGLVVKPGWLLPALEAIVLAGLIAVNPERINRSSRLVRIMSLTLVAIICGANAWSAGLLVEELITNSGIASYDAVALLGCGAAIYLTNIIVFGLWYWEFDRGGPAARAQALDPYPDFLFPQMQEPELAPPDWAPTFLDYLFVSYTNATAFSPTDTMPLSRWAKGLMFLQSTVALVSVALVIARAVNVLK